MPNKVVVEGGRELARSLRRLGREYPKELTRINKQVAEPVAQYAKAVAPKQSGRLAGSIRAQGTQREARVAVGRMKVPYAGPIHFGWPARNISPQPFLYEALDEKREEVAQQHVILLDAFIDSVWIGL